VFDVVSTLPVWLLRFYYTDESNPKDWLYFARMLRYQHMRTAAMLVNQFTMYLEKVIGLSK
jgi:hypothetical protein